MFESHAKRQQRYAAAAVVVACLGRVCVCVCVCGGGGGGGDRAHAQVSEALLAAEKDIAGGGDWTVSSEKLECMMKGKWLNDEV